LEVFMPARLKLSRIFLLACSALLALAALVVALFVIPLVKVDPSPGATPQAAVPAFWVSIGLSLLAAAILVSIAMRTRRRRRLLTAGLIFLAMLVFLLAFALSDAAFAYQGEGPAMRTAATLLFACTAADLLGMLLVIATIFLFPR
jgi:hypothetical protein